MVAGLGARRHPCGTWGTGHGEAGTFEFILPAERRSCWTGRGHTPPSIALRPKRHRLLFAPDYSTQPGDGTPYRVWGARRASRQTTGPTLVVSVGLVVVAKKVGSDLDVLGRKGLCCRGARIFYLSPAGEVEGRHRRTPHPPPVRGSSGARWRRPRMSPGGRVTA